MEEHKSSRGSSSCGEVPVKFELAVTGGSSSSSREFDGGEAVAAAGALSNGGGSSAGTADNGGNVPRVNTSPVEILSADVSEPPSSQVKLEISKTEKHRNNNILAEEAAQIFDDKIPVQQKLKLLNRIATVKDDGTVEFEVPGDVEPHTFGVGSGTVYNGADDEPLELTDPQYIPPLQIVILIVGTRGDVQPFIAIGKRLQEKAQSATNSVQVLYVVGLSSRFPFLSFGSGTLLVVCKEDDYGHRVRLATHSNFKDFVLTAGLEFYPLGGDPKILAGWPSEIPVQRNQIKDIIYSLLPACKEPDMDSGIPFKADAIIANPPVYGHTHVAEALKVPLHVFFTMPWTPTSEFPHPLSRVKQSAGYRLSYQIVDSLIWLGIRDMVNDLRKKKLKLRPVTYLSGSQGSESNVPYGYIWSPHLVPKPKDWGHKVDVVGFCFLDLASNYEPPQELVDWLKAGQKPIYIGFGSLVNWGHKVDVVGFCFLDLASNYEPPQELVDWLKAGQKPIYIGFGSLPVQQPEKMTQIIVEALETTGQRGIINKGWGGLGNLAEPKDFVYLLDNCPHDWLFLQCAAVVHHGGAGTTAAGLKAACPTTIVPFFGDQPFWGDRVHARGVGPAPIPVDEFSLTKLVDAISFMLDPKVKERAVELAKAMENEDGVAGAVKAFFKHLPRKKPEPETAPLPSNLFSIRKCFGCS
ncbi:hypothetical protein TEA_030016 [Camellia sinensis var. sinensis]|uniref:Uncharacterized protein n=1 Tax=Camellia sinensis var. sinensis TaxID=542762 RepID=A0A4S4DUZ7_CAMSN|nr:hypothetical protein TEA_030016 [Camellia sinensis var. sinensis]